MSLPHPLYSSCQGGITVRFRTQNVETKVKRGQSLTSAGETVVIRLRLLEHTGMSSLSVMAM